MGIRVVQLGAPRKPGEGPRLGTVRRPPRGVRKQDYSGRDYFDIWVPDLAPSASLVAFAKSQPLTSRRWQVFVRRYRAEMAKAPARQWLATLAALSSQANFSVGCYCADENTCHRSVLRELLREAGAQIDQPHSGGTSWVGP